jgi:hypothetical protein
MAARFLIAIGMLRFAQHDNCGGLAAKVIVVSGGRRGAFAGGGARATLAYIIRTLPRVL